MSAWICVTCGVQHDDTARKPQRCEVCEDERQYVGSAGQRWTTSAELAAERTTVLREEEPDLVGLGVEPSFGIGQRGLLVRTPQGNVLWDCVSLLDDHARDRIAELGGIAAICISHPHFYSAMVDYADAFDAPIHLPRVDTDWIRRSSPRIELFDERVEPVPGVTMVRTGGHFDGASVLHWAAGAGGRGVLLTGDTITVVPDTGWVSFMWSFPNLLPLDAERVLSIVERVEPLDFDRLYAGWWGRVVSTDAAGVVRRSAERYVARLRGERPAAGPRA